MDSEPSYLASHGEFATLENTIGSWYHQDAYLDFETDADIWNSIWNGHDKAARVRMAGQLRSLLGRDDAGVLSAWNAEAHSHGFTGASEAREFLEAMLASFEGQT
jgi:hypothetical protein